jgi:hypothetical protein
MFCDCVFVARAAMAGSGSSAAVAIEERWGGIGVEHWRGCSAPLLIEPHRGFPVTSRAPSLVLITRVPHSSSTPQHIDCSMTDTGPGDQINATVSHHSLHPGRFEPRRPYHNLMPRNHQKLCLSLDSRKRWRMAEISKQARQDNSKSRRRYG